ncbi:uncharacterized protein GGS22DRAFT_18587 [Annulohypoxylon maeteangense]|uniref:uncharacterized protein n=1 Tax=Annulohypoxylon maeteangense TaxID=1927788 RepID=UPI002007F409|nr:uncharacterized protein GGS22DRAFT_18587 [Annulohypoxylon maeteangense]KAI0884059.1 hypothetical protein GGS22DRAFT_18587 [Annulohypoxylon maeteangense]
MATVSGTTTLTPPGSSHADHSGWNHTSGRHDGSMTHKSSTDWHETNGSIKGAHYYGNGDSSYDPYSTDNYRPGKDPRTSQSNSISDHKRPNAEVSPSGPNDDEHSKWIHRDKLARIESQELQAAGIILPKSRAQSRPRRDRSQEKTNGHRRATDASDQQFIARSRKNSELSLDRTPDFEAPSWDLRLPEEIAEDPGEYWVTNDSGKSRIPVAKVSPAPIPVDFLERDAPVTRKSSFAMLDEDASIAIPKPRSRSGSANIRDEAPKIPTTKRSATEGSPKKSTTGRKASTVTKATTQGRPKTRSGPAPRSGSTTRPTTRSGEMSPISKAAPEGDPPWMVSAYKPDPRLPPDQQLLPTVAKRLQQEKWEQEGKFGNIYDREFRPLNDEGFLKPPESEKPKEEVEEKQDEWPLRPGAKSPNTSRPGTSSYSTMPKIQGAHAMSPLASPLTAQQPQTQPAPSVRVPTQVEEPQEEDPKKSGCGCCIVM